MKTYGFWLTDEINEGFNPSKIPGNDLHMLSDYVSQFLKGKQNKLTSAELERMYKMMDKYGISYDKEKGTMDPKFLNYVRKEYLKESEDYQAYFQKKLKEYGVESPEDLSDEKKKEFYDVIDKGWEADDEMNESSKEYEELQKIRQDLTAISKRASAIKSSAKNKNTARIAGNVEADIDKIRMDLFKYNEKD